MSTRQTHTGDPAAEGSDAIVFDAFARSAGASLRSPAPDDGIASVERRGKRQRNRRLVMEISVVAALAVGGIVVFTHSDRTRTNINLAPSPTIRTNISPPRTSVASIASAEELNQWFLDYTGNPVGKATGEPVKFGIVMPSFTYQFDLDTAAKYLNDQAGGVGGQPIELDVCKQPLAECADRFAADPAVVAVLENQWSGDSIGTALAGRKPLHTTYSGNGTQGVAYYPTYRETVNAMAIQAKKLTAPGGRVLVIDAAIDQQDIGVGLAAFVTPDVSSALTDRDVVTIKALDSENLVDTIRRAGATDAAAVILASPPLNDGFAVYPTGHLACDQLSDSLDELGMKPVVIVDGCDPHEGWLRLDIGYNETLPDLRSGALPIVVDMPLLGATKATSAARGIREVGAMLAVIRLINQLGGPSQATPAALDQAMRDFTGPVPLGAGPLDCSPTGPVADRVQPGSCVRFVDVHQFVHDAWIDLAPIDLGT